MAAGLKHGAARHQIQIPQTESKTARGRVCKVGRNAGREVWNNEAKLAAEYIYYRKVGDHATNMPSAVYFGKRSGEKFPITENIKYAYDKMGNISRIDENGAPMVWYKYDALNRLIREDNKTFGKTWLYSYDNNGNILCKRTTDFTLKENVEESEFESVQYEYERDKLLAYGTEACEYDAIGNPTTYRGKSVSWSNGRQMVSYNGTAFTYDGLGRRLSKGNVNYTYDGNNRIIKQSNGLEFIYDNSGVACIVYNGTTYVYRKDGQGNIVALIDSDGNVVVKYKYDAWGNHAALYLNKVNDKEQYSEADEAAFDENYAKNKTLAELNPFRYRGYYYDEETGLYYLKSRYYDPEVGRFITIDDISYIDPDTINGLNLYAYCGNNPVMNVDPNGTFFWALLIGALIAGVISGTVSAVNAVRNGGGFSDGLGAFVGGFITGGVIGAAAILGGGLAVGAFTVTVGSIIGTATFLTAGTFVGGVFANWAESKITGESFSWNDALNQGILTMFAGITNFAVGYAMGTAGLWNSLKSGNGFMDTIKLSRTAFITEVGRAGVKSIFVGALSYLQTNIVSMIVRSIIKFIFTKPWKDGISTL